jgi:hypothetical protein
MRTRTILLFLLVIASFSCSKQSAQVTETEKLNKISLDYVRLGLVIGQYDKDFVDAYYGPDSLKPVSAPLPVFPKDSLLKATQNQAKELENIASGSTDNSIRERSNWLLAQLRAFERRIKIFSGENAAFDTESKELFDAIAPVYPERHFQSLIARLDSMLPGKGPLPDRYQKLASRFLIPKDKIDTVFRTAITEARKKTLEHYELPVGEDFRLEYVTDKPWSGYNWYQGNYKSVIQINVSQPIFIERAIDLACHEGYPGHHVYNTLLEKNLYHDKKQAEISFYPLFSPQSLIAEGSANYGISVAFPGNEQLDFCKKTLMPIASMDTSSAGLYFRALEIRSALNYARNEVARGIQGQYMDDNEAKRWLTDYCLLTEKGATDYVRFIKKYRSYVINYNYGQALVKNHIESRGEASSEHRWRLFEELLSKQYKASDLLEKK